MFVINKEYNMEINVKNKDNGYEQEIDQVPKYKYLGSFISEDGRRIQLFR